jgi:tetratricopeptide (TPR) repeat protein
MMSDKRNSALLFALPCILTFIVYLKTFCPTVYTGDSGELAFAIATMGISHPPGYPLLTLFGKFFLEIMPGNTAYLLNMLSALFASAAVGVGALVLRLILFQPENRQKLAAILFPFSLASLWGFSNALWGTATGLEVYSLGALLILLSLYTILKFLESSSEKYLLFAIYMFSLGVANHLTISVLALPLALVMIQRKVPHRIWLLGFGLFILALASYLYIPLRSAHNPIADWDHPATLSAFINHITARRYQTFVSGFHPANYFENLWRSLVITGAQLPLWLLIPGIIGIVISRRIQANIKLMALLILSFNFLAVALYDIPDIEQYYLPSFFILIVGLGALTSMLANLFSSLLSDRIAIVATALFAVLSLSANYSRNDQSDNKLAYAYGMDILNSVPPQSLLISVADNSNSSVYYLHYVEGERQDLEIYDPVKTYSMIRRKLNLGPDGQAMSGTELCLKMVSLNKDNSYIAKEHVLRGTIFDYYSGLNLTPNGMVYRVGNWPINRALWGRLEIPYFDNPSKELEIKGLTMLCNLYLARGEDMQASGDTTHAYKDYLSASELVSNTAEASLHNSLGVFFRHHRASALAEKEYNLALNSRHLTGFEKANIYVNLGNLNKDRGNFDEAAQLYNQALQLNGDNSEAGYNLALSKAYGDLNTNNIKGAIENFEAALAISGSDARLVFNLGVLYDKNLNDTTKAIENYRRFAQMAPELPEADAALKRINELSR